MFRISGNPILCRVDYLQARIRNIDNVSVILHSGQRIRRLF